MSFSPDPPFFSDLPFSPVSRLSCSLRGLSCQESDTPKCKLKLSPDNGTPSPEALLVALETKTPTGPSPNSPYGLETKRRCHSRTPARQTISRPMRLLDKIQMNTEGNSCQLGKENDHDSERSKTPVSSTLNQIRSKRSELTDGLQTPAQKKRKNESQKYLESEEGWVYNLQHLFRSQEIDIEQIADSDEKEMNGDSSKVCLLPVEEGKHLDLKYISAQTVAELLVGNFDHLVDEYVVVDCRFPYEYKGGHIKGALNLYTEEQLTTTFFPNQLSADLARKHTVIIFHCEFSTERGPRVCRSLRRMDRKVNVYPRLCFPELYILQNGYRHFFQHFETLCEPRGYIQMHHKDYREELHLVRKKVRVLSRHRRQKELFRVATRC
ncbi:cell division cycle 25 homolog d isoform X1 [Narcine bancroftii]|uniref:cell division cycle 25 homolog d isoform X1 n=1 Tax=Narcine bancroftii TaxID=1343680 RepID=UPI0038320D06